MKIFVVILCIAAASNAIPLTDSIKEVLASKFDSNGPQPVDEVIAITNGEEEKSTKRVARHYGFGGVNIGIGVPVGVGYYQTYPAYYGGGYPYYGGGYPYYGDSLLHSMGILLHNMQDIGYGGGYGYGGHHHHHHHHRW